MLQYFFYNPDNNIKYFALAISLLLVQVGWSQPTTLNLLVITDIHVNAHKQKPFMEFQPSHETLANDLDYPTFHSLLKTIRDNLQQHTWPKPQAILLLGDMQAHHLLHNSLANAAYAFRLLLEYFPQIPMFYTFGNNDSYKANYGPFLYRTFTRLNSPFITAMQVGWKNGFLSSGIICTASLTRYPCIDQENSTIGYYTATLAPNLRLLSLNSVLLSPHTYNSSPTASQQRQWLLGQLQQAEEQHISVIMALHIPPGKAMYNNANFWSPEATQDFIKLVQRYAKNIVVILAGHTHQDELKIIKNNKQQIITSVLFTPALSTSHCNAPSIRNYQFIEQAGQWKLADYTTYYFTKTSKIIRLHKLYNFIDYYCPNNQYTFNTCLQYVSPKKMRAYMTAGNPKCQGVIQNPDNINLTNQ